MTTKNEAFIGYCIRGCGKPANAVQALACGDLLATCGDPDCTKQKFYPAYCDPANEVRGELFDRNLDVKDIAKLMRKAVKAELPGVKVSVRISRYSGGRSISMELIEAPGINTAPLMPMREWYDEQDRQNCRRPWKENYDPAMVSLMAKLNEILGRWNRDNSDSMSDYSDVYYYDRLTCPGGLSW